MCAQIRFIFCFQVASVHEWTLPPAELSRGFTNNTDAATAAAATTTCSSHALLLLLLLLLVLI